MKITKEYLRGLINEEVETQQQQAAKPQPRGQQDVEKVKTRLGTVSGLEDLLNKVNNRIEFEEFLKEVFKLGSKNVKPQDIMISIKNIYRALDKEI